MWILLSLVSCTPPEPAPPVELGALGTDFEARRLELAWVDAPALRTLNGAWQARTGDLRAYFLPDTTWLVDRRDPHPDRAVGLTLARYGRRDALVDLPAGAVATTGSWLERRREGVVEWFHNRAEGLEQGFTLVDRPAGDGPLVLDLEVDGATAHAVGDGAILRTGPGSGVRWAELVAFDADRRALLASVDVAGSTLRITVDDAQARWPVVIDPVLTLYEATISLPAPANPVSIDVSGDVLVVGNPPQTAVVGGSASVFERNQGGDDAWGEVDVLTIAGAYQVGMAVAVDGLLAAVGSSQSSDVAVFRDDGPGWVEEAVMSSGSGDVGAALDLDAERLLVGGPGGGTPSGAGLAYLIHRYATGVGNWNPFPASFAAPTPTAAAAFGSAVAMSGSLLVVGAPGEDAAYLYDASSGNPDHVATLSGPVGSGFGTAVAIDGDRTAFGAPASDEVRLGHRDATGAWALDATVLPPLAAADGFGRDVALHADTLAVTDHPAAGGAALVHLFERRSGTWAYVESLWGGLLGPARTPLALALDEGVLAVAAPEEGTVEVYRRSGERFVSASVPGPAVASEFGAAVAASGRLVAVGAPGDDPAAADDGTVALYRREERGDWTFVDEVGGDPGGGGRLGDALSMDGDLVLAGAPADDRMGTDAGAAMVLSFDGATLAEDVTVFPDLALGADLTDLNFGAAVAVDPVFALVGAPGRKADKGSAFVHGRILGTWYPLVEIGKGANDGDKMGKSVAVSDGLLVVGSHKADREDASTTDSGAVEVYELDTLDLFAHTATAVRVQRIDGDLDGDALGRSIDVEGQWMAIGAPGGAGGVGEVQLWQIATTGPDRFGKAYDVVRGGLTAIGAAGDDYGWAVALAGDRLYVGAPNVASVEEYRRNASGTDLWDLTATLTGGTGYGTAVDAAADTLVVGEVDAALDGAVHLLQLDADHAPVGTDDAYATPEGAALAVDGSPDPTLLANDHDPDGAAVTAALLGPPTCASPPCGTVTGFTSAGAFVYTPPDADWTGNVTFRYELTDATTVVGPVTATVTVTPVNDPPVALADGGYTVTVEAPYTPPGSVLDNDIDVDGDLLVAVLVSGPGLGSVVLQPDGTFTYTPPAGVPTAATSFQYQACDAALACSSAVAVDIEIDLGNRPPVAPPDASRDLFEDLTYAEGPGGLLVGASDPDGDVLTPVVVTLPTRGSLDVQADGSWTYTPSADLFGTDSFRYVVWDGGVQSANTTTVTLDVAGVNDAPRGPADLAYVDLVEDDPYAQAAPGVLAGMVDVDLDPLSALSITQPQKGTLVLQPNGAWTYTPDPDANGADAFRFLVSDGTLGITVDVALTLAPVNDAPQAPLEIEVAVTEDIAYAETAPGLLADAVDVDGDVLAVVLLTEPSDGTLRVESPGAWAYTPDPDANGTDTFRFAVSDGVETSAPVDVVLDVASVDDRPVAVADGPFEVLEDQVLNLDPGALVANDTDVEDPPGLLEVVVDEDPVHGTLVAKGGDLVYTPDPDFAGTDGFRYRARDTDNATSLPVDVALVVVAVDDLPRATDDDLGQASAPVSHDVLANDADPEGDVLTAELVAEPHLGDVVLAPDGMVTYTPRPGLVGRDSFAYVAHDASGGISEPALVEVVVVPAGTATDPTTDPDDTGCAATTWYLDADGDGFGTEETAVDACTPPVAHVTEAGDCDDGLAAAWPGAPEIVGDGVDQDCDGLDNVVVPVGACTGCSGSPSPLPPGALGLLVLLRRRRG